MKSQNMTRWSKLDLPWISSALIPNRTESFNVFFRPVALCNNDKNEFYNRNSFCMNVQRVISVSSSCNCFYFLKICCESFDPIPSLGTPPETFPILFLSSFSRSWIIDIPLIAIVSAIVMKGISNINII